MPAHLERAGPFNPDGNNGFNVEHLRNFNNAAPKVAFGMESQPGHGASSNGGEYQVKRNNIGGVLTDSVGGTSYGGTGVYGAQVGGVWDALLGEGRNFWFFASSDWHNRGSFGPDDRRSTQDFFPGEYARDFVMVRNGADKLRRDPRPGRHELRAYTFANPSLAQIGVNQPINMPVLDHIDLIRGAVSGYKAPGAADYAGAWPSNTAWLRDDGTTADLSVVPAAAKNTTAAVIKTFSGNGTTPWSSVHSGQDNTSFLKMTYRIPAVSASQYVRLRGTNMPPAVPFETDAGGNPLADLLTNAGDTTKLRIPCSVVGSNVPANGTNYTGNAIDGCPAHLPVVNGVKYVAFDVAAWSDLWFYSNPIYIEVAGSTTVAGVK